MLSKIHAAKVFFGGLQGVSWLGTQLRHAPALQGSGLNRSLEALLLELLNYGTTSRIEKLNGTFF